MTSPFASMSVVQRWIGDPMPVFGAGRPNRTSRPVTRNSGDVTTCAAVNGAAPFPAKKYSVLPSCDHSGVLPAGSATGVTAPGPGTGRTYTTPSGTAELPVVLGSSWPT